MIHGREPAPFGHRCPQHSYLTHHFPAATEDDAVRATLCALHIVKEMEADGHTVRAGITTGEVFMGSVGNADRGEYTFYGTTVNMAARLMVNKANTGVLVDEPTALDDKCRAELDFNPLDPITVKGRDEPLPVYEPLGRRGALRFLRGQRPS